MQVYVDAKGNTLYGQRAYVAYKRDKGDLGTASGGVQKKKRRKAGGGARRRKASGGSKRKA